MHIAPIALLVLVAAVFGGLSILKARREERAEARSARESDAPVTPAPEASALEFERRTHGDQVVVVMFFADWCPACKKQLPNFLRVAREMADQAVFLRMESAKCRSIARRLGLEKIPTTMVFRGSQEPLARHVGVLTPDRLRKLIEGVIAQK